MSHDAYPRLLTYVWILHLRLDHLLLHHVLHQVGVLVVAHEHLGRVALLHLGAVHLLHDHRRTFCFIPVDHRVITAHLLKTNENRTGTHISFTILWPISSAAISVHNTQCMTRYCITAYIGYISELDSTVRSNSHTLHIIQV